MLKNAKFSVFYLKEENAMNEKTNLTDLQRKAIEIAQKYKNLSLQDKIELIAQAFGGTSGQIKTSPCFGKWSGTSDIFIEMDNGTNLFIGNRGTSQAKTVKVQTKFVGATLARYNPEIIVEAKKAAAAALRKREIKDNEIAAQKGLKPYTFLNVEFEQCGGWLGWYYVTLAVNGKIRTLLETNLNFNIANGQVSETPKREDYYVAGAVEETDVDFVFDNVGFSSTSGLYSLPIRDDVLERAKKTLAERETERQKSS